MIRKKLSLLLAASLLGAGLTCAQAQRGSEPAANGSVGHPTTWAQGGQSARLTPDNTVIAFIDHQAGLMNLVGNTDMTAYKQAVLAKIDTAKLFDVPVVLTTSAADGPNGPMLPEIVEAFPDAPLIARNGQINAWDDPAFRDAIEATGKKNVVVSGITTDVCVAFVTQSMLEAGYNVYVVVDASGTTNDTVQNAALMRMSTDGAEMGNWFALACELMADWRNPQGADAADLFRTHMPGYAEAISSHKAFTEAAAATGD